MANGKFFNNASGFSIESLFYALPIDIGATRSDERFSITAFDVLAGVTGRATFQGEGFTYSQSDVLDGDVKALALSVAGRTIFKLTGLDLDARILIDRLDRSQSFEGFYDAVADTLLAGNDRMNGAGSRDFIHGGGGSDILQGRGGNDLLFGGSGADVLQGGAETALAAGVYDNQRGYSAAFGDIALYSYDAGAIIVDLQAGTSLDAFGFVDSLVDVEGVIGGRGNDTLNGSRGDDYLVGGPGDDLIDGRGGFDVVDYGYASSVNASLRTGRAMDGSGGSDGLSGVEGLIGTLGADTLVGDGRANLLVGSYGADRLTGGGGGDRFVFTFRSGGDVITDFKSGKDTLVFDAAQFGLKSTNVAFALVEGDDPKPGSGKPTFLFETDSGLLSFDVNGRKAGGLYEIATLTGVRDLSIDDFDLI